MWTRTELKTKAKAAFKQNYWRSVLVGLILTALLGTGLYTARSSAKNNNINWDTILQSISKATGVDANAIAAMIVGVFGGILVVSLLVNIFLYNPLSAGSRSFFAKNETEGKVSLKEVLTVFNNNYMNGVVILFLQDLYVCLWSLLLFFPGVVKSLEYRMVPYIVADNPDITSREAFALSKKMMHGNKWRSFVLDLSFIGWYILDAITLHILGIFYVKPYVYQTDAELYLRLKEQQ